MSDWRLTRHRSKWALTWNEPGRKQPLRISTGTADRGLAESRASELWAAKTRPRSDRVEDLWPAYANDRLKEISSPDKIKYAWKALAAHFGHKIGTAVTRDDCRAYYKHRKKQGKADSTARTELEMLRACLNFHKLKPDIWIPPASKPRDYWLTRQEVTTLLEHLNAPHLRLFITLAVTTGARMGAILDLEWSRVNWKSRTIDYMPAGRHKSNKRRGVVPMNARAERELKEAYEARLTDHVIEYGGKPVKSVGWAMVRLSERAGIKCSPHVFRHTAGVWMAQDDISMEKIAQYLHTTVKIAEKHYAHYSPSYMQEQAKSLDW